MEFDLSAFDVSCVVQSVYVLGGGGELERR